MTLARKLCLQIALAAAVTVTLAEAASAAAGKAVFVSPPVSVEHGSAKAATLNKGDSVDKGDVVETGAKARAQLLMADGARIALRSGSRYRIDDFALPAAVNAPTTATAVNADGRSFATLLKGGVRTTSGAIGKKDPAAYELRTPVGTLGIRGTDYAAVICQNDCNDVANAPTNIRNGVYISVFDGAIGFVGNGIDVVVHQNESIFIPLGGGRPEPLQDVPAWVLGDGAGTLIAGRPGKAQPPGQSKLTDFNNRRAPDAAKAGTDTPSSSSTATNGSVAQPVSGTNGQGQGSDLTGGGVPQPRGIDLSYAVPAVGLSGNVREVVTNNTGAFATSASGALTSFNGTLIDAQGLPAPAFFTIGTATNVNVGSDAGTGLRWGRWSGGALAVSVPGATSTQSLAQQSLHWIYGDSASAPAMPQAGTATYTLVGGTSPTDNQGHVGTLGTAAFAADFTNQTVTSALSLTMNGVNWTADGAGVIGAQLGLQPHQFGGVYQTVTIGGQPGGNGSFSGFFTSNGGTRSGFPGGVGLSFSLDDDVGLFVTGAIALHGP